MVTEESTRDNLKDLKLQNRDIKRIVEKYFPSQSY